jgi:hypothetical protein
MGGGGGVNEVVAAADCSTRALGYGGVFACDSDGVAVDLLWVSREKREGVEGYL